MSSPIAKRKYAASHYSPAAGGVLIADDDEQDRYFLLRAVKALDLECFIQVVTNGEEVISYLSGQPPFQDRARFPVPHLLLLDLRMPRMDGFGVLQWLKTQPALDGLNVVVFSGVKLDRDISRAKELGAKEFIAKPNNTLDLVHSVREVTLRWLI